MTFDEWFDKYKPIKNSLDAHAAFDGCLFETYQPHIQEVLDQHKKDPSKVWTLVEADGVEYVTSGYHLVNRIGYFITEEPIGRKDDPMHVQVFDEDELAELEESRAEMDQ